MVRSQARLNIEDEAQLLDYLRESGRIGRREVPRIRILTGGVSNRTVLVEREDGQAWVLKQALARLRVQVPWFSSPRRIEREALGLRWLQRLAPPGCVPSLVFEDPEQHLLAMEAVPQPHRNWKSLLLEGGLEREHVVAFARLLAQIHGRAQAHRAEVASLFSDRGFFESLRLEPYYTYTATQVPEVAPFLDSLVRETRARQLTLVHGDYSPKNILLHAGRLILLDHEVIHYGEPAFDLGFSMTHLLSKAHHLVDSRPAFLEATRTYWQTYQESLGPISFGGDLEARVVRHTLACLLARVAGRSPLEYLSEEERLRQQQLSVSLLSPMPQRVAELVDRFGQGL